MKPEYYKKKDVAKTYDKDRFQTGKWTKEYLDIIERGIVAKYAYGKVLDVGCGTGRMSFLPNYTGVDFSKEMLNQARRLHKNKKFVLGNVLKPLPFKNFDTVIALRLLMHLGDDWEFAFKNLYNVCKDGGTLIVDTKTALVEPLNIFRKSKVRTIHPVEILNIFLRNAPLPNIKVEFDYPPIMPLTKILVIKVVK